MNINVHIERLVLDGMPLASSQGPLVQAAVEAELTRLLAEAGLSCPTAGIIPHLPASSIHLEEHGGPARLGHQIAQAVHYGLAPSRQPVPTLSSRAGSTGPKPHG